jgi:hypothetical protein
MGNEARSRNESFFRNVNEEIEAISDGLPADEQMLEFLCECDRLHCKEKLPATRAEYESVRAVPTRFLVRADHVDPLVEHVVLANDRFLVVEKEGTAARAAEWADPRQDERRR